METVEKQRCYKCETLRDTYVAAIERLRDELHRRTNVRRALVDLVDELAEAVKFRAQRYRREVLLRERRKDYGVNVSWK